MDGACANIAYNFSDYLGTSRGYSDALPRARRVNRLTRTQVQSGMRGNRGRAGELFGFFAIRRGEVGKGDPLRLSSQIEYSARDCRTQGECNVKIRT